MQAVEFISQPHDNVVDLPASLREWNGRRVRVILLDAAPGPASEPLTFDALKLKTLGFRFDRDEANAR